MAIGYEVDFLAVGEGSRSGDAIALRFGDLYSNNPFAQKVIVIDGGYKESGEQLVEHIQRYYNTNYVDLVVSTHPDADHANGLAVVLEDLKVGQLWMHQPWNHTQDIAELFKDGRVTDNSVGKHLKESLEAARTLEEIAKSKKIPIVEPFFGLQDETKRLTVVGPTQPFYESLLPYFRGTPEPKASSFSEFMATVQDSIDWVWETWDRETLSEDGETSAENESSTILLFSCGNSNILFTGDAGIKALGEAISLLEDYDFDFSSLNLIQVPHHGSKRNVSPSILNRLLGNITRQDIKLRSAYVSASKKGEPKHPAKKVTNAFKRRGAYVYTTQGSSLMCFCNAPKREGWSSVIPLPFYNKVEE